MLTFGFILLGIAVILAVLAYGMISPPMLGPTRVAFYFLLVLSLAFIVFGSFQQDEMQMEPRVPVQEQE